METAKLTRPKLVLATKPDGNPINATVNRFLDEFEEYAKRHLDARLAIDLETTGLDQHDGRKLIVGMSFDGHRVLIASPEQVCWPRLLATMNNPRLRKAFHHGKFDLQWFMNKAGEDWDGWWENCDDTMIMRQLCRAGLDESASLATCANEYLGVLLDKSVRDTFDDRVTEITDEQAHYCAMDVVATWALVPKLKAELAEKDLVEVYEHIEKPLMPIIAEMEWLGVRVDVKYLRKMLAELQPKIDRLQTELDELLLGIKAMPLQKRKMLISEKLAKGLPRTAEEFVFTPYESLNVNSQPQVLALMNSIGFALRDTKKETLEAPGYTQVSLRTACKRFGMNEDDMLVFAYDMAERVLDLRAVRKAKEGFVIPILTRHIHHKTLKVHTNYGQLGAKTGRFTDSDPNLQQMPSARKNKVFEGLEFRMAFIADSDEDFCCYDYDACEFRILAEMTKDAGLILACSQDDIHVANARTMFEDESINSKDPRRQKAKTCFYTYSYGGGARRIAAQLKCPIDQAKDLIKLMNAKFPGLDRFARAHVNCAMNNGYVMSLSGRKRFFHLPIKPDYINDAQYAEAIKNYNAERSAIERRAKNSPIQMSNADITKFAMVLAHRRIRPLGGRLLIQCHDELIARAPKAASAEVGATLAEAMLEAEREFLQLAPSKVGGPGIAPYWKH